ncbi:hypothetical protein E2I00_006026 [Balaenoptera physalus]|uniref:Pro-opiomelanocortin N-terminal domain-containing protein n=1 Tax=Balaenoptera physalus TaxID=9770 RepID=A0A6A1PYA1_BALPH|nr:hypothetical protein E2I00_006026 [Balaenoptera physalus]
MPRLCSTCSGVLLLALLLQASMEVRGWCLEGSQCQDLTTESNLLRPTPFKLFRDSAIKANNTNNDNNNCSLN